MRKTTNDDDQRSPPVLCVNQRKNDDVISAGEHTLIKRPSWHDRVCNTPAALPSQIDARVTA